jgi:hypothetical protein
MSRSVLTNAAGRFVFDSLAAREYALTARLPGYAPGRMRVAIRPSGITEVELRLQFRPQVLDSVVIEAT